MVDVIIITVLIVLNGVFSMSEMAIASSRRARLQAYADDDSKGAKAALKLAESPNRFLSTVQLFITIISIVQGVFGGQAFASSIASLIIQVEPSITVSVANAIGYFVIVSLITFFSLVIGELVPKRLALQNPERIAIIVAPPMQLLGRIVNPFVWLLSRSTNLIIRLLGINSDPEVSVSELELMAMLEEGVSSGVFEEGEQSMVAAVFRMDDQRISSLITPRTEMIWLDLDEDHDSIMRKMNQNRYSSYPVGRQNVDNILGIVQAKDLLGQWITSSKLDIQSVMTLPTFVPESVSIANAIRLFKKEGVHTLIVLSEYGGVEGLVRMHDIIEQIFGDLEEEDVPLLSHKPNPKEMTIQGQYPLSRLEENYPQFEIPEGEDGKYETVAGFIMARLRRVPEANDEFEYEDLHFTVLAMDGVRIDSVRVERILSGEKVSDEQS